MYYYKQMDENGELLMLLTYNQRPKALGADIVEITAEEYAALVAEIAANNPPPEDNGSSDVDAALDIVEGVIANGIN